MAKFSLRQTKLWHSLQALDAIGHISDINRATLSLSKTFLLYWRLALDLALTTPNCRMSRAALEMKETRNGHWHREMVQHHQRIWLHRP